MFVQYTHQCQKAPHLILVQSLVHVFTAAVTLGISASKEVRLDSAISEVTWERTEITDDLASARASRWRVRLRYSVRSFGSRILQQSTQMRPEHSSYVRSQALAGLGAEELLRPITMHG